MLMLYVIHLYIWQQSAQLDEAVLSFREKRLTGVVPILLHLCRQIPRGYSLLLTGYHTANQLQIYW